jgi:hypothetical protein
VTFLAQRGKNGKNGEKYVYEGLSLFVSLPLLISLPPEMKKTHPRVRGLGVRRVAPMEWTPIDLRDAIMAAYQQQIDPKDIPKRFGGVSRQHVCELVSRLKPGLLEDEDHHQLRREANLCDRCAAPCAATGVLRQDWWAGGLLRHALLVEGPAMHRRRASGRSCCADRGVLDADGGRCWTCAAVCVLCFQCAATRVRQVCWCTTVGWPLHALVG